MVYEHIFEAFYHPGVFDPFHEEDEVLILIDPNNPEDVVWYGKVDNFESFRKQKLGTLEFDIKNSHRQAVWKWSKPIIGIIFLYFLGSLGLAIDLINHEYKKYKRSQKYEIERIQCIRTAKNIAVANLYVSYVHTGRDKKRKKYISYIIKL